MDTKSMAVQPECGAPLPNARELSPYAEPAGISARSTTGDREPLLTVAAAIVARRGLSFGLVYAALNHFAGVSRAREMTLEHVADATSFGHRLLSGSATEDDFARIKRHRDRIVGAVTQLLLPDLFGEMR